MKASKYIGYDTRCDVHSPELAVLIATRGLIPKKKALDLGCGNGTEALFLAEHGFAVRALDDDPKAIAAARIRQAALRSKETRSRTSFVRADALRGGKVEAGEMGLVIERLLFVNLSRVEQLRLLRVAATALCENGVLLMRVGLAMNVGWGRLEPSRIFSKVQVDLFRRYFDGPPQLVGYLGLVTDPWVVEGSLVVRGDHHAVVVATRNATPVLPWALRAKEGRR